MRAIQIVATTAIVFGILSCGSDKKAELTKLKDQQNQIAEKIKELEAAIKAEGDSTTSHDKATFVGITEIKPTEFNHYVRVQGLLDGDQNVAVIAEAPGTIAAKYADVGQRVTKGQTLAQIDDAQYKSQLQSLESQYKLAEDVFNKQKKLWDQKIGSELQYLQAKTNKESLEQQIASLKQQVDKFKIKSPIAGTIEECNIKIGGIVSPDPRLVAYRVVAFNSLRVKAEVSEAYSARVKKGDKLIVQFPDANKEIASTVDFVSNYINPVNRSFSIETKINSNSPDLKANMVSIIQINDYQNKNAITLSMNTIQQDSNGSYVYVLKQKGNGWVASKQMVKIGQSYNGIAEVVSGLTVGEKVITTGFQELIDGESVRF
ncbi:MAG: efflux RND transporter periplasmic adaptor subunit [Bacteroidales bacterium]|nr:efflux RND transporter periplasmic adaptor subunit [Bacteroidales bacterium]